VACIVDAGCVSAGETFARDLHNICKARVYGATTAGSSSSKKVFELPSGIASIRYSVRSRGGIGGKPIEFHGIEPHVPLEAIPEIVAEGKNSEIEIVRRELLKEVSR
jgi:C-terminal processing protease CtpA/Prc